MAAKREGPPPSAPARPDARDRPPSAAGDEGEESYGPLHVARLSKDDGRALILYRLHDGPQDGRA